MLEPLRTTPDAPPAGAAFPQLIRPLTPAEHRVAALIDEGLTNRVIAARLHCSPRTVDWHLNAIADKVGESGYAPMELTPKQRVRLFMLRLRAGEPSPYATPYARRTLTPLSRGLP